MDDPAVFNDFLTNTIRIRPQRVIDEILSYIDTFTTLYATSFDDFDDFVTRTHSSNSARTAAAKILIPNSAIVSLKAIMFELKDRHACDALPDLPTIMAMDGNTLRSLRAQHNAAKEQLKAAKLVNLSDSMKIVKLTQRNYQEFETAFRALASRTMGTRGIPLDYIMRDTTGNYGALWTSRAA